MENVAENHGLPSIRAAALIAEYNPLHLGHAAQLAMIRSQLPPDAPLIVILSSYFCQRGIPGLIPPRARAELAIRAGADLVLKLPTMCSTASAEDFGAAAIGVITALPEIDLLAFGLESASALEDLELACAVELAGDSAEERYLDAALTLWPSLKESFDSGWSVAAKNFKRELKEQLAQGLSYPEARVLALAQVLEKPDLKETLRSPNQILALTYLRALLLTAVQSPETLRSLPRHIFATQRIGESESSLICRASGDSAASASAIRQVLRELRGRADFSIQAIERLRRQVPIPSLAALLDAPELHFLEDYGEAYLDLLVRSTPHELESLRDWQNGLAQRAQQLILSDLERSPYLTEILVSALSERAFPRSRVQRALTSLLLNLKAASYTAYRAPAWTEVLAYNKRGKSYLRRSKRQFGLPVASRFSELCKRQEEAIAYQVAIERRAASLYFGEPKRGHADLFTPALYLSASGLES